MCRWEGIQTVAGNLAFYDTRRTAAGPEIRGLIEMASAADPSVHEVSAATDGGRSCGAASLGRVVDSQFWPGAASLQDREVDSSFGHHNKTSPSNRSSSFMTLSVELEQVLTMFKRQPSNSGRQVVPVTNVETDYVNAQAQIHGADLESAPENRQVPLEPTANSGDLEWKVAKQPNARAKTSDKSRLEEITLGQSWSTVYKRLFFVSLALNILGLILATTNHFPYAKSRAALFSVANILIAVLVRNEACLRIVFWVAVKLLGHKWVPVKIKTMVTALLQSLGGFHSSCGLSSIMWLSYVIVQVLRHAQESSKAILGIAWSILFLLSLSSIAALPVVRHIHHNCFERLHRFTGWSLLGLVWAFVLLSNFWDPVSQSYQPREKLASLLGMQSLWFVTATTFMVILPWLFVRKVAVNVVVPAAKVNSLIHFAGGVKPGILPRISPHPLSEWHAFGIISDGRDQHTVLAGAVGDFTKTLVETPPTHIWVRTFHFAGLPYLTNMYQKVLLVATGSGIGVFLSFLMQPTRASVHIIWIAKNIRTSYGEGIWEVVRDTPRERFTVIDTAISGRPQSTAELVVAKAQDWRPEVVIVTSNPTGTKEIVSYCNARSIPTFGPIWDS